MSKYKGQKTSVDNADQSGDLRKRSSVLKNRTIIALAAFSMLMLSAVQEPIGWSHLAWFALVPWVIATVAAKTERTAVLVNYIAGLAYFSVNLYWLVPVTPLGYGGLCFYLGWHFVLSGYILRQVYLQGRWPFTLVLPVVWVGQEYLRAIIMTGFPWLLLSHSQHEQLRLIQISDLIGAYGVTFLIAMVNGLLCDLLLRLLKTPKNVAVKALGPGVLASITVGCLAGAIFYGSYRLEQGNSTIRPGPIVAAIQGAVPQYVKEQPQNDEQIFDEHIAISRQSLAAEIKPELLVWPETMATRPLNSEFLNLNVPGYDLENFQPLALARSFDRDLRKLAASGSAMLIGAPSSIMADFGTEIRQIEHYNSAVLYMNDGSRYRHRYDKMHLVPFGEVVPFKESIPWLHNLLNSLTPYDYDYTLNAGTEPTVFEFPGNQGTSTTNSFAVAICYEDVMPQVPRKLSAVEDGGKRIDFLVNISNDGWFVGDGPGGTLRASSELIQHLAICRFRAIENRIGIVRAVNTGISAFIEPSGRLQRKPLAGTLPDEPRDRQAVSGFITDRVYIDSRVSIYNRIGDVFAIICTILTGLLFVNAALPARLRKKANSKPN